MALTGLWWWIDRWRKSSAYIDLPLEAQAAYRNLLDEAWLRRGLIPNNDQILARASGDPLRWPEVRDAVLAHFELTTKGWRNATLDETRKQSERRARNQANYRKRQRPKLLGSLTRPDNDPDNAGDNDPDNGPGNAADNGPNNAGANGPTNAPDNNPDNKPDSPDPDPDLVRTVSTVREVHRTAEPENAALQRRAGRLIERYAELFYQHRRGARYHSRLHLDFMKACDLVRTWPDDARLEKLAVLVLTTTDEWVAKTDRGFGVFAARASWADDRLRAWEIQHQVET